MYNLILNRNLGEGCIYLYENGAINKSDYVLNEVLKNKWDQITSKSTSDMTYINFGVPNDILQAFYYKCKGTEGLLSAMGYSSILDTKGLIESPQISNGIMDGRT